MIRVIRIVVRMLVVSRRGVRVVRGPSRGRIRVWWMRSIRLVLSSLSRLMRGRIMLMIGCRRSISSVF